MKINNWIYFILIIAVLYLLVLPNDTYMRQLIKKKQRGGKRKMPTALLKEFIGKICSITLFNDGFGVTAKVVSVEDNWIKVEDKKKQIRLLNGDMIRDIAILPEKYQTY